MDFIKLRFVFFHFNLFIAFSPWSTSFPPWFPAFQPWFPHSHPDSPHSHPDSPHSHPNSSHSYPYSPHSHHDSPHSHPHSSHSHSDSPHSHHSLHSIPWFPIPGFKDSQYNVLKQGQIWLYVVLSCIVLKFERVRIRQQFLLSVLSSFLWIGSILAFHGNRRNRPRQQYIKIVM